MNNRNKQQQKSSICCWYVPVLLTVFTLAPLFNSSATTSFLPALVAIINAVHSTSSIASTYRIQNRTTLKQQLMQQNNLDFTCRSQHQISRVSKQHHDLTPVSNFNQYLVKNRNSNAYIYYKPPIESINNELLV